MLKEVDTFADFNPQQMKFYYKINIVNSEENSW